MKSSHPKKHQPLEHDSTTIEECISPSKLHCNKPISSLRLDFLYACIANESFVVWHLGRSCLHLCEYASEHTSSLVLKNTLFSIFGANSCDRSFRDAYRSIKKYSEQNRLTLTSSFGYLCGTIHNTSGFLGFSFKITPQVYNNILRLAPDSLAFKRL